MPNNYFSFKQFTVNQQHSAMKVCTDACLFGAWAANIITDSRLPVQRILDIGAGTGLLSLMLAQQCSNSFVDAVEIDIAAAQQANDNFTASPWHRQLRIFNAAIQKFSSVAPYDFIIINPPFFQNDLVSKDTKRNIALHSQELSLEELLTAIQIHLSSTGYFAVLLPFHRSAAFETLAQQHCFYLQAKVLVQQTPLHSHFRSMLLFGKANTDFVHTSINIKNISGNYTEAFTALLKDYYLYL